ncbi:MAG: hypothetical protein DRH08_10750 [Deltaproteobacteria bacterium]|nr:MAG: hypothetical protein DRH08_10750 [Deltaproteobacteria bacterium]
MLRKLLLRIFGLDFRFRFPDGVNFHLRSEVPVEQLLQSLQAAVAFLHEHFPGESLYLCDDWLEHDGFHSVRREIDFTELKRIVADEDTLRLSMPGDFAVRVGIISKDRDWYLRFHIDETEIEGDFDLTIPEDLANALRPVLCGFHGEELQEEPAGAYYDRIEDTKTLGNMSE